MIKTGDIETRSLDLDAAGVDVDIQNRVLEAAGAMRGDAHQFIADFLGAWHRDPEMIRTEMRQPLSLDGLSLRVGDALPAPLVIADAQITRMKYPPDTGRARQEACVRERQRTKIGHPLSDAERTLLHPDAERRRLNRELVTDVDDLAREKFSGAVAYLFGAITKDPDYKRRFAAAQRYCERWGMTVLNPTRHPVPVSGPLPVDYYMRHCLIDVEACEVMVPVPSPFLEGSAGAAAERAYGMCLGRPILDGFVKEG